MKLQTVMMLLLQEAAADEGVINVLVERFNEGGP